MIKDDKGYAGRRHQKNLFETARIQLMAPLRNNQKEQKAYLSCLYILPISCPDIGLAPFLKIYSLCNK